MPASSPKKITRRGPVGWRDLPAEWRDELPCAELSGAVAGIAGAERGQPRPSAPRGRPRPPWRVAACEAYSCGGVKLQPADRVLHVELVLELERDCLGAADEQDVVGEPIGVDGCAGRRAEPGEEGSFRVAGTVSVLAGAQPEAGPSLGGPQPTERLESLQDLGRPRLGGHERPSGLREILGVPAEHHPEVGQRPIPSSAQVGEPVPGERLPSHRDERGPLPTSAE